MRVAKSHGFGEEGRGFGAAAAEPVGTPEFSTQDSSVKHERIPPNQLEASLQDARGRREITSRQLDVGETPARRREAQWMVGRASNAHGLHPEPVGCREFAELGQAESRIRSREYGQQDRGPEASRGKIPFQTFNHPPEVGFSLGKVPANEVCHPQG